MLAADPQAFLSIRDPLVRRRPVAKEMILELVHSGIRKKKGRVIFDHDRGRGNDMVPSGRKKIKEFLSDLSGCHRDGNILNWADFCCKRYI
jgi:hypothetical protein